jgi:hypothetical protein
VHEIQVFDYRPERDKEIYQKLFAFGYGTDRCRVFNYWQDDHPATVEGVDARTLIVTGGREAIVVVTGYGDGGRCRLTVRLEKLGLSSDAAATDSESGEAIDRAGSGKFVFDVNKHDFRMLHLR